VVVVLVLLVLDCDWPLGLVVVVVSLLRSTALDPLDPAGRLVEIAGPPAGAVDRFPVNNRKNPTNTIATSATMATEAPFRIFELLLRNTLSGAKPEGQGAGSL
jgi:hypothetical protein